ncbi:MAG: hypothetical protein ACRENL_08100 [Candidatus Dormibacteria bacterium]
MMRRRLAVTTAVLAAVVGEWLGHSLAYFRVAGVGGLEAGLSGGLHEYMLPLGLALVLGAAAGATVWMRAWRALGRRLDRSLHMLVRVRRSRHLGSAPPVSPATASRPDTLSFPARVGALALPVGLVQCGLYLLQENLERALHGIAAPGAAPLLDGYGAAAWIQGAVALVLAAALVAAARLLRSRDAAAQRCERLVRAIWGRVQRNASSARPTGPHVTAAQLLLRSAIWQRPPPLPAAA